MSTIRAGLPHPHATTRNLTIALIAALVAAVVALSAALIVEDSDTPASTSVKVVRVAPSGPSVAPSPAERAQEPGKWNTPGFRP